MVDESWSAVVDTAVGGLLDRTVAAVHPGTGSLCVSHVAVTVVAVNTLRWST